MNTRKVWEVGHFEESADRLSAVNEMAISLGITALCAKLLHMRGYDTVEKASAFLKNTDLSIYDPFLMKDMRVAAERVLKGILEGENMAILGDYDADGVSATALLYTYLESKNPNMKLYEYAHCTPMNWTPLEKTLAADLKTYKKLKIKGWKEEISYPDANWRGKKPTLEEDARHNIHRLGSEWLYWLVAGKLTWNASLDVNALIADFESKYYGKSYKAMKKFNDLRRSAWDKASGCFGYPHGDARTQKALTKAGTAEKMLALLDEAEKLAGNDETLLRRIRRTLPVLSI